MQEYLGKLYKDNIQGALDLKAVTRLECSEKHGTKLWGKENLVSVQGERLQTSNSNPMEQAPWWK